MVVGLLGGYLIAWAIVRQPNEGPEPDPLLELRRVLDALRCGGAIIGPIDEILAANEPAIDLGIVRGNRVAIPALLTQVREVRRTGETAAINLDQTRAGRAEQQLAVRILRLEDGNVLVVADDRSAALRVQASARDFMANATHELKTPVGAITLLGEAVEQAADDPDAVVRFARKIQAESSGLSLLVAQIVQLSRLQGQAPANAEPVGGRRGRRQRAGPQPAARRAAAGQPDRSAASGPGGAAATREQLVTALANLVHNAITYSDDKARVVVTTRPVEDAERGDRIAIAVSDNGIGISAEDTRRIFERFYRVDYARSRETGGTGLGLSIVAEIVEGHGGEVAVWSKLGSGSTFTITLPAAPAEEEVA